MNDKHNKGPMPLGKDLGQLTQEAKQERLTNAVLSSPKYSLDSPFICYPKNGWLIVEEVNNSAGKIILPDGMKFSVFKIIGVGSGPFNQITGKLLWEHDADPACPHILGDVVVATGMAAAHMYRGVTVLAIQYHQVQYEIETKPALSSYMDNVAAEPNGEVS